MRTQAKHHPHDDAPDTAEAFRRLAALPPGPQRDSPARRDRRGLAAHGRTARGPVPQPRRELEDLRQVAALGLVKAVDRYDPERGNAFESYAVPTITGEIKRHFRDHMWTLHVPRRVQDLRNRVRIAGPGPVPDHLRAARPPSPRSPSTPGMSEEDVRVGLEALESFTRAVPGRRAAGQRRRVLPRRRPRRPPTPPWTSSSTARPSSRGCARCPSASGPSSTCGSSVT